MGKDRSPELAPRSCWREQDEPSMAANVGEQVSFYQQDHGNPVVRFCKRFWTVRNLKQKLPVTQWIRQYRLPDFLGDLTAGLTLGVTVLPQGLANGVLAGLAPQYGLYTAFMGCFVYFLLGTAKDVNLGPTAIMSLMVAELGNSPVEDDATYAVALALGCGIIQMLMGLLHLGYLVQYVSHAVIAGFTAAAAITVGAGQISKLLGIRKVRSSFFPGLYDTFDRIATTNLYDMAIGLTGIVVLMSLKKLKELVLDKRLKALEAPTGLVDDGDHKGRCCSSSAPVQFALLRMLAFICTARNAVFVLLASALAAVLLLVRGERPFTLTAKVETTLPSLAAPSFFINQTVGNVTIERSVTQVFQDLSHGFVIIALVGILEQIAIGKSFAARNRYRINPNQEIFAIGVANLLGSFVSSFPVTASFSRSAINSASGVRTPASGLVVGTIVLIALAVLTPYFIYVPQAALSAVIVCAVVDMVDYEFVLMLWKVKRWDLVQFFCTFLPSFPLGIEYGILIGMGMSAMMLMYPLARPELKIAFVALKPSCHPDVEPAAAVTNGQAGVVHADQPHGNGSGLEAGDAGAGGGGRGVRSDGPGQQQQQQQHVAILAPTEGLKFAGAEYVYDKVIKYGPFGAPPKHVVLDCTRFSGYDSGTVQALAAVGDVLKKHRLLFVLANVPADLDTALTRYECKLTRADGVDDALRIIQGQLMTTHPGAGSTVASTAVNLEDITVLQPSGVDTDAITAPSVGIFGSRRQLAATANEDSTARLLQDLQETEESDL